MVSASLKALSASARRPVSRAGAAPLRRQTRRLEVVRRSLPRNVPALLTVDKNQQFSFTV